MSAPSEAERCAAWLTHLAHGGDAGSEAQDRSLFLTAAAELRRLDGGPAGSGGWQHHAENMERERNYFRLRAHAMADHMKGECWYWQGDGGDHLETLVNSLPVVIRADALRELLTAPKDTTP